MSSDSYVPPSAASAQDSFYQALADGDLDTLMSLWVNDDAVLCILPSGERLCGPEAIHDALEEIFARGGVRVAYQELQSFETGTVSVHHVIEQFQFGQAHDISQRVFTYATNVFLRTPYGWQLMLHHASQAGAEPDGLIATPPSEYLH